MIKIESEKDHRTVNETHSLNLTKTKASRTSHSIPNNLKKATTKRKFLRKSQLRKYQLKHTQTHTTQLTTAEYKTYRTHIINFLLLSECFFFKIKKNVFSLFFYSSLSLLFFFSLIVLKITKKLKVFPNVCRCRTRVV